MVIVLLCNNITILLFLHRGDCCCKCEFDTDVKIENQNDGEQLGFYKKVHVKTQGIMFL